MENYSTSPTVNKGSNRRQSALSNIVQKRTSIASPVNLNTLVRIYLLDGSSKLLQMTESSTIRDVLIALKFNLDLEDISTFAIFRILGDTGNQMRRVELREKVSDCMIDSTFSGQTVRLLFKTWIVDRYSTHERNIFQEDVRNKQPNTALWLAFMEAQFMCNTGKYYLTEEESILLGCLKMQAESGDFNPAVHGLQNIKQRIIGRFPEPIKSKMNIYNQSINNLGDEIASRVQLVYARVAGKSKIEAQIDYLSCLRTWCPFYGSTFFDVQCQYDDAPLDQKSQPPVVGMSTAVGPLALYLMTLTQPPTVMRHAYKRIVKWIAHTEKHIFTYWVIKPTVSFSEMEESQQNQKGEFDPRPYCDCVYLVSPQVREIEYLVKSYVQCSNGTPASLPGASNELLPVNKSYSNDISIKDSKDNGNAELNPKENSGNNNATRKPNRLSVFFGALGGYDEPSSTSGTPTGKRVATGSGLDHNSANVESEVYGDDSPGITNSLFKNMYNITSPTRKKRADSDDSDEQNKSMSYLPAGIQYASTMSELKRVAEESQFSDSEDGGSSSDNNSKSNSEDDDDDDD
eukprot:gene4377-6192_t